MRREARRAPPVCRYRRSDCAAAARIRAVQTRRPPVAAVPARPQRADRVSAFDAAERVDRRSRRRAGTRGGRAWRTRWQKSGAARSSRSEELGDERFARRPVDVVSARSRIVAASCAAVQDQPLHRLALHQRLRVGRAAALAPSVLRCRRTRAAGTPPSGGPPSWARSSAAAPTSRPPRAEADQDVAQAPARPGVLFGREHFGERRDGRRCRSRGRAA